MQPLPTLHPPACLNACPASVRERVLTRAMARASPAPPRDLLPDGAPPDFNAAARGGCRAVGMGWVWVGSQVKSNIQEVRARKGSVIAITDEVAAQPIPASSLVPLQEPLREPLHSTAHPHGPAPCRTSEPPCAACTQRVARRSLTCHSYRPQLLPAQQRLPGRSHAAARRRRALPRRKCVNAL